MYSIRKYMGGYRNSGRYLVSRARFIYFGTIPGKNIAIVSNSPLNFRGSDIVNIVEGIKLPLYKVDMNMRMGKGYNPTGARTKRANFTLENGYRDGIIYDVYEVF